LSSHRTKTPGTGEPPRRAKLYRIDHEGMQRMSDLGVIDPNTLQRAYWCPDAATDFLTELQRDEDFDVEKYCHRCEAHDGELAIRPDQKKLPPARHEVLRRMKLNPVALPWEPGKPACQAHLQGWHKSRPGRPMAMDACHMCLISFLEEVPPPPTTPEEKRILQAAARAERDEVFRLRKAQANEQNSPALAAYIDKLIEAARLRLRERVKACRVRGFEPWRGAARRAGEEAPAEVVATTWVRPPDEDGPARGPR
jgi:hypothetical protein